LWKKEEMVVVDEGEVGDWGRRKGRRLWEKTE
jgi:hypothetical protein